MNSPYQIILSRRITEKSTVLENLHRAESNRCLRACKAPRLVFNVDPRANKVEIAQAVEQIYADKKVKVVAVNTVRVGPKPRRVRGFSGKTSGYKKAIVTFRPGDQVEEENA
ncbi:MAG: 50S ribosomal protein L23 [Verrucomicrobiota bacterium]|nr:50S ribosomal protein L23 [Verrucomicrobiota bacterium]